MTHIDTQAARERFTIQDVDWGVLLVGVGLSIITHAVLFDLGSIPALLGVPNIVWLILGVPVGMFASRRLALTHKRQHMLLVLPVFLLLTVTGNLLGVAG